jgi:hypothetical protein
VTVRRNPYADVAARPDEPVVQLRFATLPSVCGALAVHCWFVLFDPDSRNWHRWEVWQNRGAGGTSWGHLHRDLMHPDRGVGGGACFVAAEWRGEEARSLTRVLADPESYPFRETYRYWPGPNSNTYAAWVLRQAGIFCCLDPRAIGKDFLGIAGTLRSTTGFQVETPLLGLKVDRTSGAELHVLCLTFGLERRPFALRTPFGRLALPRRSALAVEVSNT